MYYRYIQQHLATQQMGLKITVPEVSSSSLSCKSGAFCQEPHPHCYGSMLPPCCNKLHRRFTENFRIICILSARFSFHITFERFLLSSSLFESFRGTEQPLVLAVFLFLFSGSSPTPQLLLQHCQCYCYHLPLNLK